MSNFKVKAKVICEEIKSLTQFQQTPRLRPVYGNSDENKTYNSATPTGNIELCVSNDSECAKQHFFEPGYEYYVTFEKIQKEVKQ